MEDLVEIPTACQEQETVRIWLVGKLDPKLMGNGLLLLEIMRNLNEIPEECLVPLHPTLFRNTLFECSKIYTVVTSICFVCIKISLCNFSIWKWILYVSPPYIFGVISGLVICENEKLFLGKTLRNGRKSSGRV
ncbi:hypothetical protein NPIL_64301 [Nephila pilipes]|uniref:Uncharacterized protein n=1 Tax=Nephila pilipes TaxID=299642 RepID=A0A8X6UUM0_NEPPI|nr:hypothetical protein NPIL_64301 [Nephila pilipes]